ncbi:MAG TPA: dTDP-4-dehydrorhamnose 3,5-epimerase [Bacteriovoracaceae bacterium]|nr:dTDP-4-dehydrorhamnose 3,5-epimerase [Bacteriovoracaceae bacterium]
MPFHSTEFTELYVFEPKVFEDSRGYFFESFNQRSFQTETGITVNFVQDNQSKSSKGTLRGLHFQTGDSAQAKLVRVLSGSVLDVVVDLRPNSPTFQKSYSIELTAENKKQLFVPRGFAHGFVVLSQTAEFFYKCDNFYNPKAEMGIYFGDKDLAIDWKIPQLELILSDNDKMNPSLTEYLKGL